MYVSNPYILPSDGIIDTVAVERVVSGQASPTGGPTRLTSAERLIVVCELASRGMSEDAIDCHMRAFAGAPYTQTAVAA
jgi:hypothetical protein